MGDGASGEGRVSHLDPDLELTRCYRFPAAHVLRSPQLSDAENERIYGKCANPNGHGHNYALEVTVIGPLDPRTGMLVPLDWLDRVVEERILSRLGHRLLNQDPWFEQRVPTAENIVAFAREELSTALAPRAPLSLARVRLHETRRNQFETGRD